MREETRERLIESNIWYRGLSMLLFGLAYGITKAIIFFVVIFQFIAIVITGSANEPLLKFGKNLSVFIYEIWEFQTFNTEIRPFPFSPWPEEAHTGDVWLEEDLYDSAEVEEELEAELDADLEPEIEEKGSVSRDEKPQE